MKVETIGQNTIVIKKIKFAPASTVIDLELIQPIKGQLGGSNMPVPINDKGHYLQDMTCYVMSKHIEGNMKTEVIRELFESPKILPKYLIFVPDGPNGIGYPNTKIQVFLN